MRPLPTCAVSKVFLDSVSIFAFLIIFLLSANKVNAQVSVYSFSQSLTGYTPLSVPPITVLAAPWDNGIVPATLPFTFNFNGVNYTTCRISANGFITFGTTAPTAANITPLSTGTAYAGAASALGLDLLSTVSPIVCGTEGTAPNQTFVIQWADAVRGVQPGNYNFQIRLHETTNVIEFSYGVCSSTSNLPVGAQVGLRGPNNSFPAGNINNRSMAANLVWFNNTTAGIANNSFVRTVDLAYPDLGLSYKWTPAPPCTTPTAQPTALVLGSTGITNTAINGNSFTPASPVPTGYLVLRSTTNTPPTVVQVPNGTFSVVGGTMGAAYTVISNTNATTFTQTGLTQDTTYYYWVISYNSTCTGAPFYNLVNMLTGSATTCSNPTTAAAATTIGGNGFDANWSAVPGATNYSIDVSTTSTFTAGTFVGIYNNLSVGNVTTFSITGLSSLTTYYYRVRAIGASCAIDSNTITVATTCGYYNIPYSQNFDATAIGAIPGCYTRVDTNADTVQWGVQTVTYASSPKAIFIGKNPSVAMDDWFFLPGLNLTGGTSYRLFYRYNTGSTAALTENLRVQLGSGPNEAAMNQTLMDFSNINNTIFKPAYVDFTPVITGVYYIGFNGYSAANQSYLAVDDISVTLSPTCFEPTDVTAQVASITATTVTVTWTPPTIEPANGYQYYVSTSATAPTAATVPTGTVGFGINTANLSGLASSSCYYIWVRGNCSAVDKSIWSLEETFCTECNPPLVTGTTPASRCGIGSVTLSAVPNAGSFINWYAAATGGSVLQTGNNYTASISATTTYYAEAKAFGAIAKVGPTTPTAHTGTIGIQNFQSSMNFTVLDDTSLQSIDIFPIASGQAGQIVLRNSSNITLASFPFTTAVSGGSTIQTILLGYALTPGNYNLYLGTLPASGLSMNTTATIYPYTSTVANITGNPFDNTQYLGFYNWKFTTQCLSGRIPVVATVSSPPALGISSATSTICEGSSSSLVTLTGAASYNSFNWTPNTGVSGSAAAGYTFNPITTTTYTLVASQTSGSFCSNVVTHTVTVNPIPPPVSVIPASTITICQNTIQALNGSVGTFSSVPILTEDFNAATNGWTIANTSTDGDTAASQWALHASTYAYSSSTWNISIKSNDNTQFYLANADSQGSSLMPFVITRTTLQSPAFSLVGFTSATLSFWQYLRYIGGDSFNVDVSTNGGGSWTNVKQYTATQGAALNFSNATIDLSAFLASPSVMIRFNFISNWGYGWAVDNIAITGTIATALTWSPDTGLYNDSAATVPYVLGTPLAVVYAKPMITTVYSATATGANTCTSSGTITINVDPLPVGGTLGTNQLLCSGSAPSNITLTGYTGSIVRWEYADDAAFTINVTPIVNTTATLTAAMMGTITSIRYFRAVISSGVCTQVYSAVGSVSYPTTTWNGAAWSSGVPDASTKAIFSGSFTGSADVHACAVQVLSGNVTFNPGVNLMVENEVTVTGGSLTFEDAASLVQYNNAVNSGSIVYKRNTTPMRKYDYTYWSSPVANQSLTAFSPNTNPGKFYQWNTGIYNWSFYSGVMALAKGYIVRAPDIAPFNLVIPAVFNASFSGVPNNGTITTPMVKTALGDLNLLGNPYPSAIKADLLFSDAANTGILDATIYLWTHNSPLNANVYTQNDYAIYNYLGGVGTAPAINPGVNNNIPNGNIAAGEGFFIHALASGNATFKNSMRLLSSNNQFFRHNENATPEQIDKHRLWLEVTNDQGAYKQTLVGYADGATYEADRGYDGVFVDGGNVVGLYSLIATDKFSIQGRPMPFDNQDQVPLGFSSTIGGAFTISLAQFDGLFANQVVYLEDRAMGIIHNLKESSYAFTSAIGTFDDRFLLRFTSGSLSNPHFGLSDLVIYKEADWIINSGAVDMQSVRVFDIRGRLLFENKAVSSNATRFNVGTTNEVLLVQVTSVDGLTVTKKVVN
jgi:hypothetical protein